MTKDFKQKFSSLKIRSYQRCDWWFKRSHDETQPLGWI